MVEIQQNTLTKAVNKQFDKSLFVKFFHEPLVHFTLLAALLFIINTLGDNSEREVIIVDAFTQEYLFNQEAELVLRELHDSEKKAILDSFIEDELLFREAVKRGFIDNSRVRSLLIQNMRFLLNKDVPPPTEEELFRFYENNPQLFTTPAAISYDHVFFKDPATVPVETLQNLNAGVDFKSVGDKGLSISPRLAKVTKRELSNAFGPNIAKEILLIEDLSWHGPFVTSYGAHFIRIAERHGANQPPYEDVVEWATMQWDIARSRQNLELEMAEIRKGYRVEIESLKEEVQ